MFWLQNIGDLNEIWDVNDALHSNLQACTLHIQTCTMISKAQYLAFSWNKVFPIPTRGLFSCEILFYDTYTVGKFSMRGALWPTEMWRHCKIFCQKVTWRTLVIFACTGIPNILWRWLANYYVGWVGLAIIVIGIWYQATSQFTLPQNRYSVTAKQPSGVQWYAQESTLNDYGAPHVCTCHVLQSGLTGNTTGSIENLFEKKTLLKRLESLQFQ